MDIVEIIKNISLVISTIISSITLITLIVKPLRKKFADFIKKFTNDTEQDKILKEQSGIIGREENDIKELKIIVNQIVKSVDELSNRILRNESDRLRCELFDCGNRCRREIPLSGEEFRHIQDVYEKYSEDLHCNGIGKDEYNFIKDYFNSKTNQERLNKKYDD